MTKKRKRPERNRGAQNDPTRRKLNALWVQHKIRTLVGVALRVLIYARYSTDEQNPHSIDAQVSFCKRFLEALGVESFEIEVISDEGVSGERIWRPGLNEVREGISQKRWDLILVEDSSRLVRDPGPCVELVRSAIDQGIRVICINDFVDTADEDRWEEMLWEAQRHHAHSNKLTVYRIRRDQDERWQTGAAMGPLRSGYKRVPTYPATKRDPEMGPHFDEIEQQWMPVVREAFERVAANHPLWTVGAFLRETKLPGTNCDTDCEWTDKEVISMIQCEWYRGFEEFGKTRSKKTAKGRVQKRAKRDEVQGREMPHLRMVADWLAFKARDAIAARSGDRVRLSGEDHPLAGIPRDSRGPLSKLLFCGCKDCHAKMHQDGRNAGGYACSNAREGKCWNKATALRSEVHENLRVAICGRLGALDDVFPIIVTGLRQHLAGDVDEQRGWLEELLPDEKGLKDICESLINAIEVVKKTHEPLEELVARLLVRKGELARTSAEIQRLQDHNRRIEIPTVESLQAARDGIVKQLTTMDRDAGAVLQRLTGQILAVPYQQFGGNKVVLRARFELDLRALLSPSLVLHLNASSAARAAAIFPKIPMLVNLFEPSTGPAHGLKAIALQRSGRALVDIGLALGFDRRVAKDRVKVAIAYGHKLEDAGVTDPFVELTEPPANASRWRVHARFQSDATPAADKGEAA